MRESSRRALRRVGPARAYLFSEQPWDYASAAAPHSNGWSSSTGAILLLGCDHDTVTFLHYAEHVAEIPGKRISRYQVPVLEGGRRVWKAMEEFDTADAGAHPNWPPRFFARSSYLRSADRAHLRACRRCAVHAHRHARVAVVRARGDGPDSVESHTGQKNSSKLVVSLFGRRARGGAKVTLLCEREPCRTQASRRCCAVSLRTRSARCR